MNKDNLELASTPGLGRVYDCGRCESVHLQVGPVSLVFTRAAYLQLVDMVTRSAANFELMLEQRRQEKGAESAGQYPFGAISAD